MVFLAGIDEAGYGPFVGPFVVGASMFRVPEQGTDLWQVLSRSTAPKPERKDLRRLWLNDSKKVHQGPHGRKRLGRTVAAFRELSLPSAFSLDGWVTEAPAGAARQLHQAPWFRELGGPLCPEVTRDRARLDAASVRRDLQDHGCTLAALAARAVPAGEWNQLLEKTGGKGGANFAITMQMVQHLMELTGDAPLRIELDRQGGRRRYAEPLRRALEPRLVKIHGEEEGGSTYSLEFPNREVQIRFSEGADGKHLPVALGSMAAKQTRERMMDLFNAWWQDQLMEVKPTKGYGVDGKRWLAEVLPQLDGLGIEEGLLRRNR
ncbi:MAG: hypothetical protein ACYSU1_04315 [Planctomycetota bacterium]|jgi:hypothetical protein